MVTDVARCCGLMNMVSEMVAIPSNTGVLSTGASTSKEYIEHATAAVQAMASNRSSKLGTSLIDHFQALCKPIFYKDCPTIDDEPNKRKITLLNPPPCNVAGTVCLCCAEGHVAHRLWFRFIQSLKRACPVHSVDRSKLSRRRCLVELSCKSECADNPFMQERLLLAGRAGEPIDLVTFFHIGDVTMSP